jgi:aminopeptidase
VTSSVAHEELAARLDVLADLALRLGVSLREGDLLRVSAPVDAAPLAQRIAERAYRLGARHVDVQYDDPQVALARALYARDETLDHYPEERAELAHTVALRGDPSIRITGGDPDLMTAADPKRVARMSRAARRALQRSSALSMRSYMAWTIVGAAVPGWARKVFPAIPVEAAQARLWEAIFATMRMDHDDPIAAWEGHVADLLARARHLTEAQFEALHLRAPGTDLRVGLAQDHVWEGGAVTCGADGRRAVPNMPTEEVFTAPHAARVDGRVRATKPLSYGGQLIDGFSLTFEGGSVVDVTAERGEDALRTLLESDAGARRLGEVALVSASSPIAARGHLFYNTLFDENAAAHLALGKAYPTCLAGGANRERSELEAYGLNESLLHVDFMVGSADLDVDGIDGTGAAVPLMRRGEWV